MPKCASRLTASGSFSCGEETTGGLRSLPPLVGCSHPPKSTIVLFENLLFLRCQHYPCDKGKLKARHQDQTTKINHTGSHINLRCTTFVYTCCFMREAPPIYITLPSTFWDNASSNLLLLFWHNLLVILLSTTVNSTSTATAPNYSLRCSAVPNGFCSQQHQIYVTRWSTFLCHRKLNVTAWWVRLILPKLIAGILKRAQHATMTRPQNILPRPYYATICTSSVSTDYCITNILWDDLHIKKYMFAHGGYFTGCDCWWVLERADEQP